MSATERSRGSGENTMNRTEANVPSQATPIAARTPKLSAMAAATSAPNGAAPCERTSSVAFTRPSTRSGTAVCTTVSCAIHWIVFVPSPMSCGRNTMSVARNSGPDASGVRTPMAELASIMTRIERPTPNRRTTRPANVAPTSEPTPPAEITMPRRSGVSLRSSSRYRL